MNIAKEGNMKIKVKLNSIKMYKSAIKDMKAGIGNGSGLAGVISSEV